MDVRETFKLIYKVLMILATLGLGIGAVAAWWYSTPANQLLLVSGILAILTLITGLNISKLDDRDRQGEAYAQLGREIREKLPFALRFGEGGKVDWNFKDGSVSVKYAEPEVHRVDTAGLEDARRIAAEGASIDDICRTIDPGHDSHDPIHQEAFRKIVRAMIEQA